MNLGWERAVLGTALADPDSVELATKLLPGDFSGCHQTLWGEILRLYDNGVLDARALIERLRGRGMLDHLGFTDVEDVGEGYIHYLFTMRGDAMEEYVRQVLDASTRADLARAAALIHAYTEDLTTPTEELIDMAHRKVTEIVTRRNLTDGGVTMNDLMAVLSDRMRGLLDGTVVPAWVPQLAAVRSVVSYAEGDDFILIAARPSEGKSSFLRFELGQYAMNNVPVLIFNLENSEIEYARYILAMATGIDTQKMRNPKRLSDSEMQTLKDAMDEIRGMPFHVVTMASPSILEVERVCRRYVAEHGVRLIGLDYVQLVHNPGKERKSEDVSETSRVLRSVAMRYGVPVLAAAQLNREIEHRGAGDNEPRLSDLRDSGSLEQDATMIMFPRKFWADPTSDQLRRFPENLDGEGFLRPDIKAMPIRVFVKKNRNGPTGVSEPILWLRGINHFRSLQL